MHTDPLGRGSRVPEMAWFTRLFTARLYNDNNNKNNTNNNDIMKQLDNLKIQEKVIVREICRVNLSDSVKNETLEKLIKTERESLKKKVNFK